MRCKKKAAPTDHALTLIFSDLDNLSGGNDNAKIAILENSIKNNWSGVFAVNCKTAPQKNIEVPKPENTVKDGRKFDIFGRELL